MKIANRAIYEDTDERLYDFVTCFGEYDAESSMCKNSCGISIRCAIEREQQTKDEILQDLFDAEMCQQIMQ